MQTITSSMATVLRQRTASSLTSISRKPLLLFEMYPSDYYPAVGASFDPVNAVALFSSAGVTWLSRTYRRQLLSHSDVSRFITGEFNNVDMTFANNDLYMSTFVIANEVEGLRLVVRYIERVASTTLADSVVIFVGRLQRPTSLDEFECELSAKQELASVNFNVPRRTFSPIDPLGRSPADPLYEGYKFQAQTGFFRVSNLVTKRHLFFFVKKRVVYSNQQWHSEIGTARDQVVPLILGRCQMELIPMLWADLGFRFYALMAAAGHKVTSIGDVVVQNAGFIGPTQAHVTRHLGDPGGTGTNATVDIYFPNSGALLSRTAYCGLTIVGPEDLSSHTPNAGEDALPTMTAIVVGEADLPNGSGVFNLKGPTSNPGYLTRFVLTNSDVIGLDPRLVDDAEVIKTAALCDEIIQDDTNAELLVLDPESAQALTDNQFQRYNSTGVVNPAYWRWIRDPGANPYPGTVRRPAADALIYDLEIVDPNNPDLPPYSGTPPPIVLAPVRFYRKRASFNAPLTDKVKAIDFLTNTLLPSYRGYIVTGPDGRLKPRIERPADSAYLRSNTIAGATVISVTDVEPWRNSTQGLILIGVGLVTSETKAVSATEYSTVGNSIPISAASSGGVILTASGPTLAGGTTTVPPSGTFVVSGSASGQIAATIDGVAVAYTLSGDDLNSAAAALAARINATWQLKSYIRAVWDGNTTITVYSKLGSLTVPALANAHNAQLASPTVTPTATNVSGGSLMPGIYDLAYSVTTATGETFVSPRRQITIAAGQRISVSAVTVPPGGSTLNWYMSKAPGDTTLAFLMNNAGAAFFINVLPDPQAAPEPIANTAGEETIRVMASFDEHNILNGKFRWPLSDSSINQVLIKYFEASDGFAERELYVNDYAHQRRIGQVNTVEIDGAGVDNFHQASVLANVRMSKEREGNFQVEWDVDDYGILHEEGDVVCCSDRSGGFVNLPVRIEILLIHPDDGTGVNVSFTARLYSTRMLSDQPGQHPITLPTTLRYMSNPPPAALNVVIVEGYYETPNTTWITAIFGDFDFGDFAAGQIARIYLKLEGQAEYTQVDTVLPDQNNHGRFEIQNVPLTTGTGHAVKIVTESAFGYTLGLAAATTYLRTILGPPLINAPSNLTGRYDVDGVLMNEWDTSPFIINPDLVRTELYIRNAADTANLRGPVIINPTTEISEYLIFTKVTDLLNLGTLLGGGSYDIAASGPGNIVRIVSSSSANPIDGILFEYEVPPVGVLPDLIAIYPLNPDGFPPSNSGQLMWLRNVNNIREYIPESQTNSANKRAVVVGDKLSILLRNNGTAEYHLNYVSGMSRPVYTSRIQAQLAYNYSCYTHENGGAACGIRAARWIRGGNEFRYFPQMQRQDFGLLDTDPLPASIRIRVRQMSPWLSANHSPYTSATFVRP